MIPPNAPSLFAAAPQSSSDQSRVGWLVLGVGVAMMLVGAASLRSGRTPASYKEMGLVHHVEITREDAPLQFLIRVVLHLLGGFALAYFGILWLCLK